MELEELKEKWKILSDEVANQKLITHKILEKAVNDKVKTMVSDAHYVGGFGIIIMLGFLILVSLLQNLPYKSFLLVILIFSIVWGVWECYFETNNLKKFIDTSLSLYEREYYFMKHRRYIKRATIFILLIFVPLTALWLIIFQIDTGVPLWWAVIRLLIIILPPVYFGINHSRDKMKKIEDSFKEYKEFMEDNQ